jgi:dTDP-glucose 4,6-dehydratase
MKLGFYEVGGNMNLLVTGGAGFIGCNFIKHMLKKYPSYKIINLDNLTYAGNLENLVDVSRNTNYIFEKADICDKTSVELIFVKHSISHVINFAAESHVDRSIIEPDRFMKTNIVGTQILLDVAMKNWKIDPLNKYCMKYLPGVKFVQVSTDEVYGTVEGDERFKESMPLLPNSPYAAAKASADIIVRAYSKTFGLPINITRCSNNYGPYQFPEKLIPLMILNCLNNRPLPVYGDGLQIRDWLHVNDHCKAIDTVLHKGISGEIYNIGANCEKTNIEIINIIIDVLNVSSAKILHIKDRPGHDRRYAIDNTKIRTELEWEPLCPFDAGIHDTIKWYNNHQEWIERIVTRNHINYYGTIYNNMQ